MIAENLKVIIDKAFNAFQSSKDPAYKEMLGRKIEKLKFAMCLDQEVADLSCIEDEREIADYLAEQTNDLEQSI